MPAMSAYHRRAAAAFGTTALLAVAVPALAAGPSESLASYKITGAASAHHGKVTFHVHNTAKVAHELVVIKTAKKASKVPVANGEASEKGSVGEVVVKPGKSKRLTLHLARGHYVLLCNMPGHYMKGMHKDFTVK
jgi:uncharacterized cupredoxin-like copper-binding protein